MVGYRSKCSVDIDTVVEDDMVKSLKIRKIDATEGGLKRCLCSLPMELLSLILGHLSFIDHLSFRAVCKCWRFALSDCFTSFQHLSQQHSLWVVFLTKDESVHLPTRVQPVFRTTGKLGDTHTRRVYGFDIPELCGTRFLLSKYGWLLLVSSSSESSSASSLFFFNPLFGSKINLPSLDVSCLNWPIFEISAPPTSQDCIIFVTSRSQNTLPPSDVMISTCRRGEQAWTTRIYPHGGLRFNSYVINVVFVRGIFYCLHNSGDFSAYDVLNNNWSRLRGPKCMEMKYYLLHPYIKSYVIVHEGDDCLWIEGIGIRTKIKLKDPLEVVEDLKFFMRLVSCQRLIEWHPDKAVSEVRNVIKLDSVSPRFWFGICKFMVDGLNFVWEKNWRIAANLRKASQTSDTIAWLEPGWVQSPLSLNWGT